MNKISLLICVALLCAACSNSQKEAKQETAAPETSADPSTVQTADNKDGISANAETAKQDAAPEPAENWPPPEPSPEPPELKSDYWPAPADGYFPVPLHDGKPIPFKKFVCSDSNGWVTCDLDDSIPAEKAAEAYGELLTQNGFSEEGGYYFKRFGWNTVRAVKAVAATSGEEGRENEKPHLHIEMGKTLDRDGYYKEIPDGRIPFPVDALSFKPNKTLQIKGNLESTITYVYERKIITEKDEAAYEKAGFSNESIDNMKNFFVKKLIPDYEKRLQLAGFKKDPNNSVYVRKLEDSSFLSVAIEPECYVWDIQDKFERKNNQMCITMSNGRIKPTDTDDCAGLYYNLPDKSIPYPKDAFYHKAYKYQSRSDEGDSITFTYKAFPKSIDYIKDLKAAHFIESRNDESIVGNREIQKIELKKDADNGQETIVEVTLETLAGDAYAKSVYDSVVIRMSKGEAGEAPMRANEDIL